MEGVPLDQLPVLGIVKVDERVPSLGVWAAFSYSQHPLISRKHNGAHLRSRVAEDGLLSLLHIFKYDLVMKSVDHPALSLVPHDIIMHSTEPIIACDDGGLHDLFRLCLSLLFGH